MPRGLIFTTLSCTHSTVSLSPSPSYPFPFVSISQFHVTTHPRRHTSLPIGSYVITATPLSTTMDRIWEVTWSGQEGDLEDPPELDAEGSGGRRWKDANHGGGKKAAADGGGTTLTTVVNGSRWFGEDEEDKHGEVRENRYGEVRCRIVYCVWAIKSNGGWRWGEIENENLM